MPVGSAAVVILTAMLAEPPQWVRDQVRESCKEGVLAAIEESTNAFTRQFVTEEAVERGIARDRAVLAKRARVGRADARSHGQLGARRGGVGMKAWLVDPPEFREIKLPIGGIGKVLYVPVFEFNPKWDLRAADTDPCPQPVDHWELFGSVRHCVGGESLLDAKVLVLLYAPRGRAPETFTLVLSGHLDLGRTMYEVRDLLFRKAEGEMPF